MTNRCQSCGMPLNKDPNGGGTENDGTKSSIYCSLCYHDGDFRHPNTSVEEFQAYCVKALMEKGMPKIVAWAFTRGIPKLSRWAN